MNKNVSGGVKGGKAAKGVTPRETSRIGMQVITTRPATPGPISVPLGNTLTQGTSGPAGGRSVQPCGTQGRHGGGKEK